MVKLCGIGLRTLLYDCCANRDPQNVQAANALLKKLWLWGGSSGVIPSRVAPSRLRQTRIKAPLYDRATALSGKRADHLNSGEILRNSKRRLLGRAGKSD